MLLVSPGLARAQLRRATSPVWQPPVSIASVDDALSVSVDPAALAHLRGWSAVYVHADAEDSLPMAERGDALYVGAPLFFGLAAGASLDHVRPSSAATARGALGEHTMFSIALAWAWRDQIAVGAAGRVLWSGDPRIDDLFTLDLAASWRPLPYFAVSLVARDLTGPGLDGGGSVPRSFVLGLALRPTGTRVFTLDVAGAVDDEGRVGARVAGELEVPWLGRLHAGAEVQRVGDAQPDFRMTAGAIVDWGPAGAGGGLVVGDGFTAGPGWYVTGRLEGFERIGIPTFAYVADVVIEDQGARSWLSTTRRLERALRDPQVRGVLIRMRGSNMGLAYAQELRLLVDELERAGKPVVCHLSDATGAELYACAGAQSILIDPAGGVRLYGPAMEITHLAGLLRELGIRADFVRIGPYKSAVEEYQNDRMSEAAREARETNLDDVYARFVWDLARDLSVPESRVREIVDGGPYVAEEAVALGLVDGLADENDMEEALRDAFGGSFRRERTEPDRARRRWGRAPRVGVVVVDGEMVDGDNLDVPILEIHASGGRTIAAAIDAMASDPAIAAIVVRIDSPGGSVLAADQIWRAIRRARQRKPVIASMGAVAASGGYYVASACDEIWADPATMTGSIGVWFGKVDVQPLAERLGVRTEQLTRGRHAGAESLWRPFTAEERALLADMVRHWYRAFLRRVAVGRGMRITEVDAVARGRVWTGDRALELGLVDRLGGFYSALVRARRLGGLPEDADFEVRPSRPSSLADYLLGELSLGVAGERGATEVGAGEVLGTLAPEALDVLRTVWILRSAQARELPLARVPLRVRP